MISMSRGSSLSMLTTLPFEKCLNLVRQAVHREGFQVIAEIPFHREFERQIGLPWKKYTVLILWSPFLAYQAILSDRDAGIFMPFHFVVAEDGDSTLVAATDHALFGRVIGKVGILVLARHLTNKIQLIFSELAALEEEVTVLPVPELKKEAS